MKHEILVRWTNLLEKAIAVLLLVAIAVYAAICSVKAAQGIFTGEFRLELFMETILTLVVGIEFVRMLILHTAQSVIEVLLYAVARQIVIYHDSALENLWGVSAIALIFVIQRYLLDPKRKTTNEKEGILDEG